MNAGARHAHASCIECGEPIVHRRTTARYCSGKCREIHNAHKRRQARGGTRDAAQPACAPETACVPETEE